VKEHRSRIGTCRAEPCETRGVFRHLQQFLDWLRVECGLADNTISAYRRDLADFLGYLAGLGLTDAADVELAHIESYLRHLSQRGMATSSVARRLAAIRMFWKFLAAEGFASGGLVNLLESPRPWKRLPRIISYEQVLAMLHATEQAGPLASRDRAILELFYAAGLRVSELVGLRLGDVNLEVGFVRCIGKGRRERVVPIGQPAVRAIREYLSVCRPTLQKADSEDYIFLSRTGKPLDRHNVYRLVTKYARMAALSTKVTPHTLRHCFASHFLAGGADLRIVQELLGHASVTTTQIYTHVDRARLKRIHQRYHPRP